MPNLFHINRVTGAITIGSETGLLKTTDGLLSTTTDSSVDWDAAHTHISNDGTDHFYINQPVTTESSPTFPGVTLAVEDRVAAPTGSESAGTRYIVTSPASGDFTAREHSIATALVDNPSSPSDWDFASPAPGWKTWVKDEEVYYICPGIGWIIGPHQDLRTSASPTFAGLYTGGIIDASTGEVLVEDNDIVEPSDKNDGYIGVAIIDGQPRLYFTVNGDMYYVNGTAMADGWTSPTGFDDPDSAWLSETNIYDADVETFGGCYYVNVGKYLELTLSAAISCNKVRIYAATCTLGVGFYDPDIDIDVFYGGVWNNIFSGSITKQTWVEKSIGSTETVSKARIKWNTLTTNQYGYIYEFDFWSV